MSVGTALRDVVANVALVVEAFAPAAPPLQYSLSKVATCCVLSAPMTESHRRNLVNALGTWDFKPHELDDGDLYRVATLLFEAVLSTEGLAGLEIDQGEFTF